jgi:hypothetical protein
MKFDKPFTAEQIAAAEKFARSCKSRPSNPTGGEAFRLIPQIAEKLGLVKGVWVYGPTGDKSLKFQATAQAA